MEFIPPAESQQATTCESKMEDTDEIAQQMKKKPGYVIEKQGREG